MRDSMDSHRTTVTKRPSGASKVNCTASRNVLAIGEAGNVISCFVSSTHVGEGNYAMKSGRFSNLKLALFLAAAAAAAAATSPAFGAAVPAKSADALVDTIGVNI